MGRHRAEIEPVAPPDARFAEQGLDGRKIAPLKSELQTRRVEHCSVTGHAVGLRLALEASASSRRRGAREQARTRAESAGFARTASRRLRPPRLPPAAVAGLPLPSCRVAPRARGWPRRRAVDGGAKSARDHLVGSRVAARFVEVPATNRRGDRVPVDVGLMIRVADLPHEREASPMPFDGLLIVACGECSQAVHVVAVGADDPVAQAFCDFVRLACELEGLVVVRVAAGDQRLRPRRALRACELERPVDPVLDDLGVRRGSHIPARTSVWKAQSA